ncbi:MAG TPA: YggT family protein [Acidimicrobiales bacterium]|nr:YggT family protein [Acidimicrobiales bacterium]
MGILAGLVELYVVILIVRALLSWFPVSPGSGFERVLRGMDRLTEPVLRPVRRILPPVRAGGMGIDLSILVVVLVAQIVLIPLLRG